MNSQSIIQLKDNKYIRILVIILAIYMLYLTYLWINTQTTDNAYIDADISLVSPEVNGTIKKIYIAENMVVAKDEVIAELDEKDYTIALARAIADIEATIGEENVATQRMVIEKINLNKYNLGLGLAKTEFNLAQIDYKRTIELNKDKFASQKILDAANSKFETAKKTYNQALLDVESSEKNLILLSAQKASVMAKLEGLTQAKNQAEKNLASTKLKSPISGTLGNTSLRVGNYVRTGSVLFSVVPEKYFIRANFKETQITKFKPGMKTEITIDFLPGKKFKGVIRSFSPATGSKFALIPYDNATGNFTKIVQRVPIIIDFEEEKKYEGILPGMSAKISVKLNQ